MINRTDSFRTASASPPVDVYQLEDEFESMAGGPAYKSGKKGGKGEVEKSHEVIEMEETHDIKDFLAKMDDVTKSMQRITRYTEEMEKHHRLVLTAVNPDEAARLGRIIDEFTSKVNDQANSIRFTLKACSEENDVLNGKITSSDMRIRRTQQAKQAKRFIELMKKYQDMQNLYKSKYRAQLERQYLIVKPMATREELDRVVGADGANVLTQQMLFSMSNKALAQTQLTEMKERHHEIVTIEKSIQEIHQMFMDMALIVDQQGELIDRLGEHVENTLEYTQKGAKHVEAAVASKRRSQRIKWILSIVGIVLLIIIGVTLWIELGGSKGGSSSPPPPPPPPPPQQQPPPQPQPQPQQPPPPQQQQQRMPANHRRPEPQGQPPQGQPRQPGPRGRTQGRPAAANPQ